jgi:hypothetical protein
LGWRKAVFFRADVERTFPSWLPKFEQRISWEVKTSTFEVSQLISLHVP